MAASGRLRTLATIATALSFIGMARDATATDYTWSGTSALWSSANWTSGGGYTTFPSGSSSANTAIINSGTVSFGVSDTFGNADTTSSPVIRVGSGATLASGGGFTTIYNLELNGGTLFSNGGANASVGTFQLGGTLVVGGSTASTISTGAGANNVINVGAAANSVLTMNVDDVTNTSAADLTIGTVLQNYYQAGVKVGSLTKAGAGTAVLTAANTYTGTTRINAGTLQVGGGGTTGSLASTSAITGSAGGTIAFNRTDNYGGNLGNSIGGAINLTLNSGALTLTSNNTYSGTTTINSGTLNLGGGGTAGSLGTGPVVNNGSLVFDRYTNNWTVASPISGSGSVTKRGGATMTLSGSNTVSGDFNQWGGVTILSNTTGPALYADGSPGRIVISNELGGATYFYAAVAMGAANQLGTNVDVSIQPRNITSGYSYLVLQGNDTTIGNLSSTQAYASAWGVVENQEGLASFGNSRLTVTQTVDGTFTGEVRNGGLAGAGTLGLTKNGVATLTLVDVGNAGIGYTGSTIVNAGKLVVSSTNFTSAVSTASGATFEIANATSYALNPAVVVSGSGVFAKSGAGTLTLSGTNTNSGGTVVTGGALAISNDAQLGASTGGITLDGGALGNNGGSIALAAGRTMTLGTGGGYLSSNQTITVNGPVTGPGALTVAFNQGAVVLSGSSTYAGATTIGSTSSPIWWDNANANPTLRLGNASALPVGTPLVFGTSSRNNTATLDLNGYSASVGGMTAGSNAIIDNTAAGTATLSMGATSGTATFAGVIKNTSGAVSVVKTGAGTQVLTGANTYTGTTTVSAGTLQVGSGGTTGALGTGPVVSDGQLAFNRSNALTVSAAISGTGGVSQIGTGTTTLTGGNTFTGNYSHSAGVTVLNRTGGPALFASGSAGTLAITNTVGGANNWYSAVVVGSTNQLGSNVSVAFAPRNVANGLMYFVLQGNDTTIGNLSSTAPFASAWAIVENQETGSYGNSRLTVTQTVDGTFTGEFRNGYGTSVGTLGLTKNGAASLTLTSAGGDGIAYTGSTSVNAGTLRLTGSAASPTFAIAAGAVLDLASGTTNLVYGTRTYAGGGTLRKTGSGLLAWSGSTTISLDSTGTVDVQEGTLQASVFANQIWTNNQSSLNVASGAVFAVDAAAARFSGLTGSGTVRLGLSGTWPLQKLTVGVADASSTFGGVIANGSGTAPFEKIGSGTLTLTGANTYSGTTTIAAGAVQVGNGGGTGSLGSGAIVDNAALIFNRSGALTVANVISGSGSVAHTGPGTTTLTAASSYTGGTTIVAGILATSAADRLLASGSLTVNAPGTFQMGGNQTLASIAGNGAITLGSSTLTTGSSSSTFAGTISGNGGLTKVGPGTLTLTGSNSFLGDTAVQAGTLELSSSNALASDAVVTMQAGSSLTVNQRTFIGALDQGGGTVNGPGTLVSTLTLTSSGSLNAVLADGPDFAAGILKRTSGTTTVGAANTFTGAVKVQGGTLQLATGGSFDAGSSLVMSPGATMDLNGYAQTFSAVNGSGGTIAMGSGSLTVANAAANQFDGAITGSGGLVKQGVGNLVLTGTSTYAGATSVAGGRLSVNGVLGATPVTVLAGAQLGGSGAIGGPVSTQAGGSLSPGNSIASLATGTATFAAASTFAYEVDSADPLTLDAAADLLVVNGDLTLDPGNGTLLSFVDLNVSPQPFIEDTTIFALINYSGSWNGGLFSYGSTVLTDGSRFSVGSQLWEIDYNSATGGLNSTADYLPSSSFVIVTAVPEPSTIVLVAWGTGLGAFSTWRRRKRA